MSSHNLDLNADPQVMKIVNELKTRVAGADVSDILRAAVCHFFDVVAQYEQEVYIREQVNRSKKAVE